MANVLFPKGREGVLDTTIDMTGDVRVMLVKDTYVYDAADEDLADIGSVDNGRSAALSGKSYTSGVFDASDTSLTATDPDACDALILFQHTGSDSTARLIAYIDTPTSGLPFTPSAGQTINIAWDSGAVAARVAATGIGTAEDVGEPSFAARIAASGIASVETTGSPIISADILALGIQSAESVSGPVVSVPGGAAAIACLAIGSQESVGRPVVSAASVSTGGFLSRYEEPLWIAKKKPHAIRAMSIETAEGVGRPFVIRGARSRAQREREMFRLAA